MCAVSRCDNRAHRIFRLRLDECEQRPVAGGGWHADAAAAVHADCTERLLGGCDIGGNDETGAAAFGQARQRNAGIALAELVPGQKNEVGAVTARSCATDARRR
jgi:hypothetical protein